MQNLLVVGGTGRNVGKTEFVCRLIAKISAQCDVYALKVSAVFPDEQIYHGDHTADAPLQCLYEEVSVVTEKDTSRMLRAGAKRVFYLRSNDAGILKGFQDFVARIPRGSVIICESNSLGLIICPALHIVVKSKGGAVKARAVSLLEHADLVVISDGKSGFSEIENIIIKDDSSWHLLA